MAVLVKRPDDWQSVKDDAANQAKELETLKKA
jgi:hypothetical protein